MRKTFPLTDPRHKAPRVVEQIKSSVRKYLKRERRKELPEGVDFWDFDCRTGRNESTAIETHVSALTESIDTASREAWESIYIEILAKFGRRTPKARPEEPAPVVPAEDRLPEAGDSPEPE
jgi:hypothetical protein